MSSETKKRMFNAVRLSTATVALFQRQSHNSLPVRGAGPLKLVRIGRSAIFPTNVSASANLE